MVNYYTLYTIVYNWFYVLNSMRRPVLVSLNWFEPLWTGFLWFSLVFWGLTIIGNQLQLWFVPMGQKNWTELDL
jgi:hypothetical protein